MQKHYDLYTDGGCLHNPNGPGGYGVVINDKDTGTVRELSKGYRSTTNNRMEIMAVIAGLSDIEEGAKVDLYSDSQYVLHTINGYYSVKKNQDLWQELFRLVKSRKVRTHWVRGHSGNVNNERCDELATLAMQSPEAEDLQKGQQEMPKLILGNLKEIPEEWLYYSGERRAVNKACEKGIKRLNKQKKPSFEDFRLLKTEGTDGWSTVKSGSFVDNSELLQMLNDIFRQDKNLLSCLRWYGRGLRLDYAIKKTLVDMEVSENAIKAHKRR